MEEKNYIFKNYREAVEYAEKHPNITVEFDAGEGWKGQGYFKDNEFISWLINPEGQIVF